MKKYLCGWSLAFLIVFSASTYAAPTGREIMQIQKERHQAKDEEKRSEMHLIDRRGRKKVRDMVFYSFQGADKLNKAMLKFKSTADIRGVGVLTWGRASGDMINGCICPRPGS